MIGLHSTTTAVLCALSLRGKLPEGTPQGKPAKAFLRSFAAFQSIMWSNSAYVAVFFWILVYPFAPPDYEAEYATIAVHGFNLIFTTITICVSQIIVDWRHALPGMVYNLLYLAMLLVLQYAFGFIAYGWQETPFFVVVVLVLLTFVVIFHLTAWLLVTRLVERWLPMSGAKRPPPANPDVTVAYDVEMKKDEPEKAEALE